MIKKLLSILVLATVGTAFSQTECTSLSFKASVFLSPKICDGTGGAIRLDVEQGDAPYQVSISDYYTSEAITTVETSKTAFALRVPIAGAYLVKVKSVDGCVKEQTVSVNSIGGIIRGGISRSCDARGRKNVQVTNVSGSLRPITISYTSSTGASSSGIQLSAGSSSTVSLKPGVYTANISTSPLCSYPLKFRVSECKSVAGVANTAVEAITGLSSEGESTLSFDSSLELATTSLISYSINGDVLAITSNSDVKGYVAYLYDVLGKLVVTTSSNSLDLSSLTSGVYILKVVSEQGELLLNEKIVK